MLLRSLLVFFYSLLVAGLWPLVKALGRLQPKLKRQTELRPSLGQTACELARMRAAKKHAAVFFCSSAGEFEQAKPLIDRLVLRDFYVQIIFFSRSGYDYAKARGESLPYCLCPPDTIWQWGWLLSALRPTFSVVVRHELWPAFLETARHFGPIFLIDASRSIGESKSRLKRYIREQLFNYFAKIYVISESDQRFFTEAYHVNPENILVAGDTKYDRAVERTAAKQTEIATLSAKLNTAFGPYRRFIIGSAHRPDVELCLTALEVLPAEQRGLWQLLIAPHDVSPAMVTWIKERCQALGLATQQFSQLAAFPVPAAAQALPRAPILIVDTMGQLAEFYGTCQLAFVGGAMHHQVHNVLEPASHGLALAFGPFYKNSPEADFLVKQGIASVIRDKDSLVSWWLNQGPVDGSAKSDRLSALPHLQGAADFIANHWRSMNLA